MRPESTDGPAAAVEGSDDRAAEASSFAETLGVWLDDILSSIPEGFAAVDDEWRFTYVNPAAARAGGGGNPRDVIGRTALDALDINPHNPFHLRYLESKKRGEAVAFTAYSELFGKWLQVRGWPHAGGYAMMFREVLQEPLASVAAADRRRQSDIIRSINQRIFETSLDLLLVSDSKGNLVRVSPSAMVILGYRPDEMIGHNGIDFIFPGDLDSTRSEMRAGRRGRQMRNFDSRYVHKDGRIVPLSWTGVWSPQDQQHFFIGRDMTERVAAEERLRRAERLEAIGQLTGGIAHDFNNLLAIVMGNLELVFDRPGLDEQTAACARTALHAAQRGAELTRGLLTFARQQPLTPKMTDANGLIADVTSLLQRTLGQHIQVKFIGSTGPWPVLVDPASLEAAITNLAVNARDAMPDGGHLTIETRNITLDAEYARNNPGVAPGDYVAVMVSDTGSGMPPEVLNRIFEPFFTTKEPGKGTGLGLSMVFGFARQSGGYIKAYSEPGHGSTIQLYLPRAAGAGSAEPAVASTPPPARSEREECILVVDDNDAIRQMVHMQLTRLGYKVLQADSAAAALDILGGHARVDLLFTDIIMPGGRNGHTLAREAQALRPDLKVLYTSGFPRAHLASAGGMTEGGAVLGKPYRLHDLARKVREVLDG